MGAGIGAIINALLSFKPEVTAVPGSMAAKCEQSPNSPENHTNVLGDLSEGTIGIENKQDRALIDTGSIVLTVSQSFYDQHLTDLPIKSLNEIILECADGEALPYSGYVMIQVNLSHDIRPDNTFQVLEVPDTDFNTQIPILFGTNIIKVFKLQCEESHKVDINSTWNLAFKCLVWKDQHIKVSKQHWKVQSTQQ